MILPEEEARKRWCPFAGSNGRGEIGTDRCIADRCMAWRKRSLIVEDFTQFSDPNGNIRKTLYHETGGYCGIAGEPAEPLTIGLDDPQ